jgi:DNA (cytosine-5)-methyltransferase 1
MRVVEEARPRVFLLENVGGLAYKNKSEGLRLLLEKVHRINRRTRTNYQPVGRLLRAERFGVPQTRERFFLVASRDGRPFHFPVPTHREPDDESGLQLRDDRDTFCTAWDALVDAGPEPGEQVALTGKWADLLPSIPEGQNYLWHTDRGGGQPLFGWRRRFWSFLLKLAKNRPSWTLQAQPGPATGPFHWNNRRLSMRELCRLQTFPDDVRVVGNPMSVRKQVGNAVPSLLAETLARAIGAQLLGMSYRRVERLLLPPRRSPAPPPEPPTKVPRKYMSLRGTHTPHPGTGRGFRAVQWAQIEARDSGDDSGNA